MKQSTRSRGFTLIEILTAIFIFAVIVTTVFGSYNAVFSGVGSIERSMAATDMAKTCLDRMTTDLQAVHVALPPMYKKPEFDAPPDPYRILLEATDLNATSFGRLRFASQSHLPIDGVNRPGIAEIVYYVQEQDDQYVLRRADRLFPFSTEFEENSNDPVLCEGVKSLAFTCLDDELETVEEWDSDDAEYDYATPHAIRIDLAIGQGEAVQAYTTTVSLFPQRGKIE